MTKIFGLVAVALAFVQCSLARVDGADAANDDAGARGDGGSTTDAGSAIEGGSAIDRSSASADGPSDAVTADEGASAKCARSADAGDDRVLRAAAGAIVARQVDDGAILIGPTTLVDNTLNPYFANLAARSLCLASCALGDASYVVRARRWLDWYAAHMNPDGTVFDYLTTMNVPKTTGDYDSTDSYAATFVDAVRVCDGASPGLAAPYAAAVAKALGAIDLTYQADGLTFAKPTYRIKYTMDNVEVRRGLSSGAAMATTAAAASALGAKAAATLAAIDALLWVPGTGRYTAGIDEVGMLSGSPGSWYPDTMAQLMSVAWLPRSARRDALYASVKASSFNVPATIANAQDGEYAAWWGVAAKTAGDKEVITTVKARFTSLDFAGVLLRTAADYGRVISIFVE